MGCVAALSPGVGSGGEGKCGAGQARGATLAGEQFVQRAERSSFAGEEEDVGCGALPAPVPGGQRGVVAELGGCAAGLPAQLSSSPRVMPMQLATVAVELSGDSGCTWSSSVPAG